MAAARTLTNQFFYNHFVIVDLMPFDGDLFNGSTVSQNIFNGVLHREETTRIFWRSNKQMDVVQHGGSRLVVRDIGEGRSVVGWNNRFNSKRVRPLFVESKKFLHQIIREKSNLNARFNEGRMPVHRLIFIRHTVYNSCDLAVYQALSARLLRRFAGGTRF